MLTGYLCLEASYLCVIRMKDLHVQCYEFILTIRAKHAATSFDASRTWYYGYDQSDVQDNFKVKIYLACHIGLSV